MMNIVIHQGHGANAIPHIGHLAGSTPSKKHCIVGKFQLRALIGKTTMGKRSAEALREVGGVYLSKIGLSGNALRDQVKKVHTVYFLEDLGKTEATWIYEVKEFGPFFVAIDADGNNYFSELDHDVANALPEIEQRLGIPANYQFTDVNAEA